MNNNNNSPSLFQANNPVAQGLHTIQHAEVSPNMMQNVGLNSNNMTSHANSLAQQASREEGVRGLFPGIGAGVCTVGAIAAFFSAPVTIPVLALGAVIGGIYGYCPRSYKK
jgi:hypothetical protein